jgi:hypothetical protein
MSRDLLFRNVSDLAHDDVQKFCAAFQRQLSGDFAPIWGVDLVVHFVKDAALGTEWGITFDPRTAAEYLGEHHLDAVPRGVVLVGACREAGDNPFEVGSHEGLELAGDPYADVSVQLANGDNEALESCDAVQGSGYNIDGVPMANFVTCLGYFRDKPDAAGYDFRRVLKGPHEMTPEGYRLIQHPGQDWTQVFGQRVNAARVVPGPWTRRGRRLARGK